MIKNILVLLSALTSTFISAQSKPLASLPFIVEGNCIYFHCAVNEVDSVRFLFDTGADGSVINEQSLGKLPLISDGRSLNQGSNGVNEVANSSGNKITIGSVVKEGVSFAIIPFGTNTFDGIIGTDLMKEYIIEINYQQQKIHFYADNNQFLSYEGYTKYKMYSGTYPTYVKSVLIIDGKKYKGFFGLDTGADDALTIAAPFAKKNDLINKVPQLGMAGFQGSDGSAYEMSIVLIPEIEIAGKHLYRIPTALSNATEGIDATDKLAGFFGNALLNKFNIILDYKRQNIYLKLNNNLYKDYSN